jgi:hypothetical protein
MAATRVLIAKGEIILIFKFAATFLGLTTKYYLFAYPFQIYKIVKDALPNF